MSKELLKKIEIIGEPDESRKEIMQMLSESDDCFGTYAITASCKKCIALVKVDGKEMSLAELCKAETLKEEQMKEEKVVEAKDAGVAPVVEAKDAGVAPAAEDAKVKLSGVREFMLPRVIAGGEAATMIKEYCTEKKVEMTEKVVARLHDNLYYIAKEKEMKIPSLKVVKTTLGLAK